MALQEILDEIPAFRQFVAAGKKRARESGDGDASLPSSRSAIFASLSCGGVICGAAVAIPETAAAATTPAATKQFVGHT